MPVEVICGGCKRRQDPGAPAFMVAPGVITYADHPGWRQACTNWDESISYYFLEEYVSIVGAVVCAECADRMTIADAAKLARMVPNPEWMDGVRVTQEAP